MSLLRVEGLSFAYPDEPLKNIFEDLTFTLEKGEIIAFIGHSGVGKTSLLNVLAGLKKPTMGSVYLNDLKEDELKGKISYMLQEDMLLPYYTVERNVALPYLIKKMKKKDALEKIRPYFKEFKLDGYERAYPKKLSGGMRQRAALMRTYFQENEVMLLDEPFSALDMITRDEMHKYFLEMREKFKLSAILITHSIDEALTLADKVYVLKNRPAKIFKEIKIDRGNLSRDEFLLSSEFLEYKKDIIESLQD